jgi:hypothetical protein
MSGANPRGARAIHWIEAFCLFPAGPDKGKRVRLSPKQRQTVLRLYDNPAGIEAEAVPAPLAGYLALLHVCGPEGADGAPVPQFGGDFFQLVERDRTGAACCSQARRRTHHLSGAWHALAVGSVIRSQCRRAGMPLAFTNTIG